MKITSLAWMLCFAAACSSKPAPQKPVGVESHGTLNGTVKVVSGTPCQQDVPACKDGSAGYEVVVYFSDGDGKRVAEKATTAADGTFSVRLPPGKFYIYTPAGPGMEPVRNEVVITGELESKIELTVDTGVRSAEAP